jgi:hypothetical protein
VSLKIVADVKFDVTHFSAFYQDFKNLLKGFFGGISLFLIQRHYRIDLVNPRKPLAFPIRCRSFNF